MSWASPGWTAPVTDRTLADVQDEEEPRGYFQVADWQRIGENYLYLVGLLEAAGYAVSAPAEYSIDEVDEQTIPGVTDFNSMCALLEFMKASSMLPPSVFSATLKYDWSGGQNVDSPDYGVINDMERTELELLTRFNAAADYRVQCGVAQVGEPRHWQTRFF